MRTWRAWGLALACFVPALEAGAQCADGSPPPCRSAAVAAAPRRANPPLDDKTWIVVPFDNLRNVQEIDWLKDASVNLLYLDMSRWRDIRVIDDERVADLLREVPEARTAKLDLNAGLAVAKRAGAGKLVMGDLLQLGNRTSVTAKVYDVRNGQRLRSVQEQTTVQDSVMPLFGKLAQKILNVAPPSGTTLGAAGTTRTDAYQEYLLGVAALNRFDVQEARTRLARAIELDSAFALAHYKMSLALGWGGDAGTPQLRTRAETAERLAASLPPRERALIKGQVLHARGDEDGSCATYAELIRTDSSDVEAWYGLGECSYHNQRVDMIGGDSAKLVFRGNWNTAMRAFERVLAIDPTYHIAFQHMMDVLGAGSRSGCLTAPGTNRCVVGVSTLVRVSGDSLLFAPVRTIQDSAVLRQQRDERYRTDSRRQQLTRADAITQRWVFAGPAEARARVARATVLHSLGRLPEALAELALVRPRSFDESFQFAATRLELAIKLGNGREAVRLYDSVRVSPDARKAPPPLDGAPPGFVRPTPASTLATLFGPALGHLAEFDSAQASNARGAPPEGLRYMRAMPRAAVGAVPDSLGAIEEAALAAATRMGALPRGVAYMPSMPYSLTTPRSSWPALDSSSKDLKAQMISGVAFRDSARLRRAAVSMDSLARVLSGALVADTGLTLAAAEAFLALRDSTAALRSLRFLLDTAIAPTSVTTVGSATPYSYSLPRAMLLRAELAAGLGQRNEARAWFTRFLDLWSTADAELKPLVDRARRGNAAVGGTP